MDKIGRSNTDPVTLMRMYDLLTGKTLSAALHLIREYNLHKPEGRVAVRKCFYQRFCRSPRVFG